MKHISILITTLLLSTALLAQSKFAAIWEGGLSVGGSTITLVFHVTETKGKLDCKMDSPNQGQSGLPCTDVKVTGDSVFMELAGIGIAYVGKMEGNVIDGLFLQGGYSYPLKLEKTNNPTVLVRPQTPKPPFSYKVEDVSFSNADKSLKFGGTITIPEGAGPFPAMLLITGSGAQNRDEEIFGHKPFAVLADYLTKRGFIVLRVDDRGVGASTGDPLDATTLDFVKDAEAGLNYLSSRKETDKKRMGLVGHSEGALIAMMLANKRKDVNFIVSLAGPGVPITELMEEQSVSVFESNGADSAFLSYYRKLYSSIVKSINAAKDSNDAMNKIQASVTEWKKNVPVQTIADMGLVSPKSEEEYVKAYVNIYNSKWFNYFLHMDPTPYIEKLSCSVLVLNGEKDIQVVPSVNLAGFRKALAKSPSRNYEVKELKGLNHLFQTCNVCNTAEYASLSETLAYSLEKELADWLIKNVK